MGWACMTGSEAAKADEDGFMFSRDCVSVVTFGGRIDARFTSLRSSEGVFGDDLRLVCKLELVAVFLDQWFQFLEVLVADGLVVEVELPAHVLVDLAEAEDVDGEQLGNVHQQDLARR